MLKTSEKVDQLAPALAALQAEAGRVHKGARNNFDHYDYARLEDFVAVAQPLLEKHSFAMVTSGCSHIDLGRRETSKGREENAVHVSIGVRLIHTSGQWVEVLSFGEGQDRGDKGTYKALTGSRKYGVAMLLGLVTTDDPESGPQPGHDGPSNKPPRASDKPSGAVEPIRPRGGKAASPAPVDLVEDVF